MLLALDIGNSRLKWALYHEPHPSSQIYAHNACFLDNIETLYEREWSSLPVPTHVLGCIVAGDAVKSKVDEQLEVWTISAQWLIASDAECGVINGYDHPTRLGSDRWVAMIGARHRAISQGYSHQPLVVVMVGTAVTIDALDPKGHFLGGFILPGHGIMLKALEKGTAGLNVPTGHVVSFPTNTSDALTSGGTFAIAGAVERMISYLKMHCQQEPRCIMTGGAAWKIAPAMAVPFEIVDSLIFEGMLTAAQHRFFAK